MMKTNDEVKLHNKPFEEMELEELYAERVVHRWHRGQTNHSRDRLKKKQWWLKENMPIPAPEEIRKKYEDGTISLGKYRNEMMSRKKSINARMRNEDRMIYAARVIYHEDAVVAYIDELIAEKLAKQDVLKKNNGYDPRKRASVNNIPPPALDPQRRWATRAKELKAIPQLQHARARFRQGKADDEKLKPMKKMQPIITWDVEKLMSIARDRGYFTDVGIASIISEALNITITSANALIKTGKLSWGQCMVIGAVFEMTPKEFCDVFMSGYFQEVADGVYRAKVDDYDMMLDAPYKAKVREKNETDSDTDSDNRDAIVCICGNDGNT